MSELRTLADLLGEVADRLPRGASPMQLDSEALAMLAVALPELTATCDNVFDALAEVAPDLSRASTSRSRACFAKSRASR